MVYIETIFFNIIIKKPSRKTVTKSILRKTKAFTIIVLVTP